MSGKNLRSFLTFLLVDELRNKHRTNKIIIDQTLKQKKDRMKYLKNILILLLLLISPYALQAKELIIEAENCQLLNGSTIINSSLCSGGRKVGNMGGAFTRNGGIQASFTIEKAGSYTLNIYYLNSYTLESDARNLYLKVNSGTAIMINCPSTGSWDVPHVVKVPITLVQGTNTITINNPSYYGADVDMIIIEEAPVIETNPSNIRHFTQNNWQLNINVNTGITDILYNGKMLIAQTQAKFHNGATPLYLQDLKNISVSESALNDTIGGTGSKVVVQGTTQDDKIQLTQNYYLYSDKDFILTDFTISSAETISSNYLSPINTITTTNLFSGTGNKALWLPYDNDKWIRYNLVDFGTSYTGYEVSAFLNNTSRLGMVVGSVEHDVWKTGVRVSTEQSSISKLEVFGGTTSYETRDLIPHGTVKGTSIKSPKIFVGYFTDWRRGMETYADVNEALSPRLAWNKGKPFLWNSWGAIQTNLSYTNATEVSQYFAEKLTPAGFENDSTVYIDLDSYWDNIAYMDLFKFAKEVKARGQNPGIYWTPFVDWAKNPERIVEGTSDVRYKDIYLYADGKPQEIASAYAVDPTHPATKKRIDLYINRFLSQGFTFLKLDFMSHGALEADSHYDPDVFTGMQAYNQGMQYIMDYIDGRMFINLSISPLFPAQYAHSRRIACDAYASISDTEYTLNSLSYGWWLDRVYTYNDADNVVLNSVTNGENRARITSSVITGIFCVGDDFSSSGSSTAKLKAETLLTNREVNRVAKLAKAFYPVENGNGTQSANMFMQHVADTLYLAVFNFSGGTVSQTIDFNRIGLTENAEYKLFEMWSGITEQHTSSWTVSIPRRDVKFYKIYKNVGSGLSLTKESSRFFSPNPVKDILFLNNKMETPVEVRIFDIGGKNIRSFSNVEGQLNVGFLQDGIYFFSAKMADGSVFYQKIMKE